jgi:RNA-directed DNA polymerase
MQGRIKYNLDKSPLYGLSSKTKLYKILVENNNLLHIPQNNKKLGNILVKINNVAKLQTFLKGKNYRVFPEKQSNRIIQDPNLFLKLVHKKLANLLSRINTPEYLHSGVKRKSYVTNATHHLGTSSYILKLDLRKFYQNCSKEFIFKAFKYNFNIPDDVAWLITDIVIYNGFLPTGSPVSQIISFFAYQKTFDKINGMAKSRNITFSLYVDDMVFSSNTLISDTLEVLITEVFEKVNLPIHKEKTQHYKSRKQYKIVTGCTISPSNELKVPNKRRLEIIELYRNIKINSCNESQGKSLLGKIQAARQIEPNIFEHEYLILTQLVNAISDKMR